MPLQIRKPRQLGSVVTLPEQVAPRWCGTSLRKGRISTNAGLVLDRLPSKAAAISGSIEAATALLEKEESLISQGSVSKDRSLIRAVNSLGDNPLANAAFRGDKDMIEFLLGSDIDPETRDIVGLIPFSITSWMGHRKAFAVLGRRISKDSMDVKDNDGRGLLHLASLKGQAHLVKTLLTPRK